MDREVLVEVLILGIWLRFIALLVRTQAVTFFSRVNTLSIIGSGGDVFESKWKCGTGFGGEQNGDGRGRHEFSEGR